MTTTNRRAGIVTPTQQPNNALDLQLRAAYVNPSDQWAYSTVGYNRVEGQPILHATATQQPAWTVITDDGAGSRGIPALIFNTGGDLQDIGFASVLPGFWMGRYLGYTLGTPSEAVDEAEVIYHITIPPDWDGTCLYPYAIWSPTNTAAENDTVVWSLEYSLHQPGQPRSATLTSHAIDHVTTAVSQAMWAKVESFGSTIGVVFSARLYRNMAALNDTHVYPIALLTFGLIYPINSPGSQTPTTK